MEEKLILNETVEEGLASVQAELLAEREKLMKELGFDSGLADQKGLIAAAKVASKRGKVKKTAESVAPTMARRSLRCVYFCARASALNCLAQTLKIPSPTLHHTEFKT